MYFWLKTIKGGNDIKTKKFSFDSVPKEYFDKAKAVAKIYAQIPFTELWNEETINSTLNQIQYFTEANLFDKPETGIIIGYKDVEKQVGVLGFHGGAPVLCLVSMDV